MEASPGRRLEVSHSVDSVRANRVHSSAEWTAAVVGAAAAVGRSSRSGYANNWLSQ